MTESNLETPGLWNRTWVIDRFLLQTPPQQISETIAEAFTRTSNFTMRADYGMPDEGFPNLIRKIAVDWNYRNLVNRSLTDFAGRLEALAHPFDFAVFKQFHDIWDGDGSRVDFYLNHRCAVPGLVVPQNPYSEFTVRVIRWSASAGVNGSTATALTVTPKDSSTIDSDTPAGDEAFISTDPITINGRKTSRIRLGTAPGSAPYTPECLEAVYVPFLSGKITRKAPRQYQEAGMEPRSYTIEEFG